eukprot:jgi/Hompol1/5374/HPOL_004401-RA
MSPDTASDTETLGSYHIISDLGEGAFSTVRLARSVTSGLKVAVKFIDRKLISSTPTMFENVEMEIDILKSISHPSILRFIELIDTATHRCIVTECVPGVELFSYVLESDAPIHERHVRYIFHQLAEAACYLHTHNICHRDIKLENIMINHPESHEPEIKLIDFGLAVRISPPKLLTARCGSEEYAAPELVQSLPYDGRKTDIWAMGIVLFALLFKTLPFSVVPGPRGGGVRSMFHRIARAEYRIPQDHSRSASAVELVRSILTASPARRIGTDTLMQHPWLQMAGSVLDLINKPLVVAIALPFVGGFIAGQTTKGQIKGWYAHIKKPSWCPPNWAFGPVWATLYLSMGYASYRIYSSNGDPHAVDFALQAYAAQLALNLAWTPLFFGLKWLGASTVGIVALLGAVGFTGIEFYKIDPVAGLLFIPYFGWVSIATSLTIWIWLNNPATSAKDSHHAKKK